MPARRASREELKVTGLPSSSIVPAFGCKGAGEDVHQGRLAGAVVADQPHHFSLVNVQVDAS